MTTQIRKMAFAAILSVTALGTITMTSCKKDDVACDAGYEGTDCKTEVRTKFINASGWSASETGSLSGASTYSINILSSSTAVDKILISNMYGVYKNDVVATVSGSTLTIVRQDPDGDKFYVQGSGTLSGSNINITYTVSDESGTTTLTDNVTGTWTKK